jgi:hypothetical protein
MSSWRIETVIKSRDRNRGECISRPAMDVRIDLLVDEG